MSEKAPKRRRSYLVQTILKTGEDFGATEIISEIMGGIVIAFLACKWGFANRAELTELIFLCIGAAILTPVFGFIFRLIFITPAKMVKELDEKTQEMANEIETLRTPILDIEAIPCDLKPPQYYWFQILIHNKSKNHTADDVRAELVTMEDELKTHEQIAHFHPEFPFVLSPVAPSNTSINPESSIKFNLFRLSPSVKDVIMKDGIHMGYRQKVIASFSKGATLQIGEKNTALFGSGTRYPMKLAATARNFPRIEREFDLIIYEKGSFCQITLEKPK